MISIYANKDGRVSVWWNSFYDEIQRKVGTWDYKCAQQTVEFNFNGRFKLDIDKETFRIDFKDQNDYLAFILTYCK